MSAGDRVQVLGPDGPDLDLVDGEGEARALIHPGAGALLRTMNRIKLGAGARTREQRHADEAVYYVLDGSGDVAGEPLREGAIVHVAPGVPYGFRGPLDLVGGPCPPEGHPAAGAGLGEGVRVFHRDTPDVLLPMIASDARLVVWIGAGARNANMNYVSMRPDEENVPHAHAESEDTIYILSGRGTVEDLTHEFSLGFEAGQAIQVPPGVRHRVKADRGAGVVSVGGPCPSDVAMLKAAGVL